jgi:hypothetical protein
MPNLQYCISVTSNLNHSVPSFDILQRFGVFINVVAGNGYFNRGIYTPFMFSVLISSILLAPFLLSPILCYLQKYQRYFMPQFF